MNSEDIASLQLLLPETNFDNGRGLATGNHKYNQKSNSYTENYCSNVDCTTNEESNKNPKKKFVNKEKEKDLKSEVIQVQQQLKVNMKA